ncbi:MAG: hypothetical protein ACJ8HU_04460, partial [Chthoniobacterales bacterium]
MGPIFVPAECAIGCRGIPIKPASVTPSVEHNPLLQRLSACCQDEGVAFQKGAGMRDRPMNLQRLQVQRLQRCEQVFGPMIAEPLLAQAGVYEPVLKDRWTYDAIFA